MLNIFQYFQWNLTNGGVCPSQYVCNLTITLFRTNNLVLGALLWLLVKIDSHPNLPKGEMG